MIVGSEVCLCVIVLISFGSAQLDLPPINEEHSVRPEIYPNSYSGRPQGDQRNVRFEDSSEYGRGVDQRNIRFEDASSYERGAGDQRNERFGGPGQYDGDRSQRFGPPYNYEDNRFHLNRSSYERDEPRRFSNDDDKYYANRDPSRGSDFRNDRERDQYPGSNPYGRLPVRMR